METQHASQLAVILHADVVGSTDLVQRDESLAHQRIQAAFQQLSTIIREYDGVTSELRGDALVAEFHRASDAVCAALAFQRDNIAANHSLDDIRPQLRIGIGMGEVVIADGTVTGAGVVLAQRLEQLAETDGVCIQGAAYETMPRRLPFDYTSLGEQQLKGFDEPVRAYAVSLQDGASVPAPQTTRAAPVHSGSNPRLIGAAAAVLLVVTVGVAAWWQPWVEREQPARAERMAYPLPDKPSIAVLPFDNLSGDPEQDYFVDGLTEDIITELSRFGELFVIARNSTFTYKNKAVRVGQVAEELGVRYVLEGSVRRTTDQLLITAQLIDASNGAHLWAERYERPLTDFRQLEDEVLQRIVSTVASRIDNVERRLASRKVTSNLNAYDLVLQGHALLEHYAKASNDKARRLFRQALELDSRYARAFSGLTNTYLRGFLFGWDADVDALALARENVLKAISLDDQESEARASLGWTYVYEGRADDGVRELDRAIALNPNDVGVLANGVYALTFHGSFERAVEQARRAMRLDPFHPDHYYDALAWALYFLGRYDEALAEMLKLASPNAGQNRLLAALHVRFGQMDKAKLHAARVLELEPGFVVGTFRYSMPFKNADELEFYLDDLRTAGLPENPPPTLPAKPSVAVLPFTNMSGQTEQEYFVDGMTEDLITDLSKVPGLFVIARNSSFTYKGRAVDVKQVSRELGVKYVLEGSVRRAGDRVRINAQLIDATSGGHLWAERYDGSLQDVFALQDQVTRQIVTALKVSLGEGVQQSRQTTDSIEAHDAFLRGWAHFKLGRPDDLARGITHFERAIEIDPGYSQAHAALASTYWNAYVNEWAFEIDMPSFRAERRANEHLEKALEKPTPLAHALQSQMLISAGLLEDAIEEAELAVSLDGNDASAYAGLANALVLAGSPSDGRAVIETAMRLDPHHPPAYLTILGAAFFGMDEFERAVEVFQRAIKRNPGDDLPRVYLAASYAYLDLIDAAETTIEKANFARYHRGRGALTLEKPVTGGFSPFRGEVDFKAFGAKAIQDRVRAGLARVPALMWQYLVSYQFALVTSTVAKYEVQGATGIDLEIARDMHQRGVPFIDVSINRIWREGHIPGAVNLPGRFGDSFDDPSFRHSTVRELAGLDDEMVLYFCGEANYCGASYHAAKAVAWGYKNVYWLEDAGPREWAAAGYPIETAP